MRMRHCVMCPVRLHNIFPHYLINEKFFEKKKIIEHKICILIFFFLQIFSEAFFVIRKLSEIWQKMYIGLHVKYPLFLSDFSKTLCFSADFRKIFKYQPVEAELFHADRHDKTNNCFFAILRTRIKLFPCLKFFHALSQQPCLVSVPIVEWLIPILCSSPRKPSRSWYACASDWLQSVLQ